MNEIRWRAARLFLLGGLCLATWTCGGGGSGAGAGGGAGAGSGAGGEGGLFVDGGSGKLACSADLRSVVDADGNVVSTCPPDQGCLGGECVAACAAAAGSQGNVGCDFRVTTPGSYPPTPPPCFAVFVTNTWPRPAKLGVTRGGESFDVTKFARIPKNGEPESTWPAVPAEGLPANEVAVLFLSSDPNAIFPETQKPVTCPVPPAVNASTVLPGTGRGEAFRITSDTPISAYDILPYGGAESHFPSAQLLFPTSAWGENYVVIATPPGTHDVPGPLWGHVLATEDDTKVEVLPSADLPAGPDFPAAPKGATAAYTLAAGQYLQWELPPGSADLSGTVVLSDKPVAVFAGNRFYRLQPAPAPGGESTHQQISPVTALAGEYVAAPYETRRKDLTPESIHYRIVGAFDGTLLAFDPPVPGAPGSLEQGQIADFTASGPFRLKSQDDKHPFAIAQIMDTANIPGGTREGATAPGYPPLLGDEEFVVMLPPQQFLSHYVFFTDPAYPTTNLALTRVKTPQGFHDVTVDCLGTVSGWQPAGTDGRFEVTTVDLVRAGIGVNGCKNGRHTADSEGPFGVVVWGLDSYSSYAYPAGGNAAKITDAVVPPVPK
ncbi:IgGFc-binding protein [Polyangium aurulentum]|uniref:IgGFc-binding protein n=1 Tax=Polyangium aurulentum TaxID=2567896 RepID=UPI00146F9265|nr:IgGFc-binding protein [Polyangium aurulentum]UQA56182.1 IgGFc-binding protein [Polyangium aurulentum]